MDMKAKTCKKGVNITIDLIQVLAGYDVTIVERDSLTGKVTRQGIEHFNTFMEANKTYEKLLS